MAKAELTDVLAVMHTVLTIPFYTCISNVNDGKKIEFAGDLQQEFVRMRRSVSHDHISFEKKMVGAYNRSRKIRSHIKTN